MSPAPPYLHRAELLLGTAALERLAATRVILFGVGGVGSWCAEALVRTGVGHLTLVDSDRVSASNVNRQLQATPDTVGAVKVDVLQRRLQELNPDATIVPLQKVWDLASQPDFDLAAHDYVIDAIDSLSNKLGLLHAAVRAGATLFSSMGASARLDPTRVRATSIWRTEGCPLARKVRKRLRRQGFTGDFVCVYSDEEARPPLPTAGGGGAGDGGPGDGEAGAADGHAGWDARKATVNGSLVHVTATFGMVLAGLVVQDVARRSASDAADR